MAKFRTTGSCPPHQPNLGGGCGLVLDKVWETNAPEKVVPNVQVRCARCMSLFMAVNTPISEAEAPTNDLKRETVETFTKPLELVIEYTRTTTYYKGDPSPCIQLKPTGRVRTKMGNWFDLPKTSIEKIGA